MLDVLNSQCEIIGVSGIIKLIRNFQANENMAWDIFKKPDRVDWVPGVEHCIFDGEIRTLDFPGVGKIREKILCLDHDRKIIEYSCIETPGNLENHHAKIEIRGNPNNDSCTLVWTVIVSPKELEPFIEQSMLGCLGAINELLTAK